MTPAEILALKQRSGLTWPEFADAVKVGTRICRYWTTGERKPGRQRLASLNELKDRLDRRDKQNKTKT